MKIKPFILTALLTATASVGTFLINKPLETKAEANTHKLSDYTILENTFNSVSGGQVNFFRIKFRIDYHQANYDDFAILIPNIYGLTNDPHTMPLTLSISTTDMGANNITYHYSTIALKLIGMTMVESIDIPGFNIYGVSMTSDDRQFYDPLKHYRDWLADNNYGSPYFFYMTLIIPYNIDMPPGGDWQSLILNTAFSDNIPDADTGGLTIDDLQDAQDTGYGYGLEDGYDVGYDEGYTDGVQEGNSSGYQTGYNNGYNEGYGEGILLTEEEAYENGYQKGSTDSFLAGFQKWIVPAIIIVLIGGGVISIIAMKRRDS